MADFKTYISDPDFWTMKTDSQIQVLDNIDPEFMALSPSAKIEVIKSYTPGHPDTSPKPLADLAPEVAQTGMEILGGFSKAFPGRVAATAIGAGGGEAFKQIYQHITDSPESPKTSTESAKRIGKAALMGGGLQAAPELVLRGMGKLIPKVSEEFLIPGTEFAEGSLREAMGPYAKKPGLIKRGLESIGASKPRETPGLTISQKADPLSGASKMESIIKSSFFGGTPIKRFEFAQEKALKDMAQNVSDEIWRGVKAMAPSEQGNAFIKAYDVAKQEFTEKSTVLYDALDGLVKKGDGYRPGPFGSYGRDALPAKASSVGGGTVNLSALKGKVEAFREMSSEIADVGLSEAAGQTVKKLGALDDALTFSAAHELRSRLLSEARMLEGHEKAQGVIKSLVSDVDTAMEVAAKKAGPDVYAAWRKADDFYKAGKERLDNDFVTNVVKYAKGPSGQPELVGKKIFQNGEVTQIKLVKKIADQQTWQSMKAGWLEDVLATATNADGITQGAKVFDKLKAMSGKNKNWWESETIKEIFDGKEIAIIRNFEQAARLSQKDPKGGGGSMLIQLMQAPALANLVTIAPGLAVGGAGYIMDDPETIAAGVALLATPRILGNMLVTKKYQDLFIKGLDTSRPIALPAIIKLAKGAIDMNNELRSASMPKSVNEKSIGAGRLINRQTLPQMIE